MSEHSPLLEKLAKEYCTCIGYPPRCNACLAQAELAKAAKESKEKKP